MSAGGTLASGNGGRTRVALFVRFEADMFRPQIGLPLKLLESRLRGGRSGPNLLRPAGYNGGDAGRRRARRIWQSSVRAIRLRRRSRLLRRHDRCAYQDCSPTRREACADTLAAKTQAIFVSGQIRGMQMYRPECHATAAYHDPCSSPREMGVGSSRARYRLVWVAVAQLEEPYTCCGFSGSSPSNIRKSPRGPDMIADARAHGSELIIGGDLGCLLHLSGILARRGEKIAVRHAAEVLAGMGSEPAIGEADA